MSEQFSSEQLDKEADAVILQMQRDQTKSRIKFGAMMILLAVGLLAMAVLLQAIPAAVASFMGV